MAAPSSPLPSFARSLHAAVSDGAGRDRLRAVMTDTEKRNLVAQWALDTRPVLLRFHLWLDDVEVERAQAEAVSDLSFTPRAIARCLAMTSAATALGTRLFGKFGEGKGKDKHGYNQAKKAADAISAYVMSEGLWHLTRQLPENHAIMVCLGEGLMPKVGETPEMGANPLLGFGRVYARPEVARKVDYQVHRLLNEKGFTWEQFYEALRVRGITVWGAAVDTLENTSRFAEGKETGPMTVLHLFDSPLTVSRPYESYMGCLTLPRPVTHAATLRSVLLDYRTPRRSVLEAIEHAYPGIRREHVHVWTLRGKSREKRLGHLWAEWKELGVHLVEDGWIAPSGLPVFTDSGTYAPHFLVKTWKDEKGEEHLFLCDGYAATAEAMQAASLSEVLDVDATMAPFSPLFELPHDLEYELMKLQPSAPEFAQKLSALLGREASQEEVSYYAEAIRDAARSHIPLRERVARADDFLPEKHWRVLACTGYMSDDPYTGAHGVEDLGGGRYRVTTKLATRSAASTIRFTFRLKETLEQSRLVFQPLLVRFLEGQDYRQRPVKISDSGRIRNELQTMLTQALEYLENDRIRVHFDRVDPKVMPKDKQVAIRQVLEWYQENHPVWFSWLEIA